MLQLTRFGLERSRFTLLAMFFLIATGIALYNGFPKREDPEISIRQSVVTASFNGMTPERMENLIASPLERKIREIPEVDEIKSLVTTGNVVIDVILKDDVTELDGIWQELRDKMEEVSGKLPKGTRGPNVNTNFGDVSIASIALTGDGFTLREMELAAKELQRKLYTVKGIAKVDLFGVQPERIWLEADPSRMNSSGVQLQSLIRDLRSQNAILPAGTVNAGGISLLLEASGEFKSVDDISMMLTQISEEEGLARLKDYLDVKRSSVSPKQKPVYFNGQPAIVISAQMQSGFDIEALGAAIRNEVDTFEAGLPIGCQLNMAAFQPDKVTLAVDNAVSNVFQTFIVVMIVIMLFLGLRSGLIVASIVPFAVMFTLIGMSIVGIDLEQVSIAALIISLGLLVDNGVVVVEDMVRRIKSGVSPHDAALAAGRQFATPLLISSMTTIFAFTPFFLLQGGEGEYAFSLGAVVAITLIGSWISAMYLLPYIGKYFLANKKTTTPAADDAAESESRIGKTYDKALRWALAKPLLTMCLCYVFVAVAILFMGKVPNQMFPDSDRDQVLIYMDMPKGTDISATETTAMSVSRWLMNPEQNPDIKNHVVYVGSGGPRFYLSLSPADTAPESAFFLINFKDFEAALAFAGQTPSYLLENFPEARFKIKRLAMGTGESGRVEVKLAGPNLDRLMSLARQVEDMFYDVPGVVQNENDWGNKIGKIVIDIDQDKARRAGVTSESLSQALSGYFDGYEVSQYREGDQSIPIVVRARENDRNSLEDIVTMVIGNDNVTMSLEQFSTLRAELEYSQIRRLDQVRTITVTGKSSHLTAGEFLEQVQPQLDKLDLSGGHTLELGGELSDSSEINGKLASGLPVAGFLMLAAIIFQFNSFRRTTIVFLTIPLIIVGVPFGLLGLNQPMSFFGTLGLISLAGIVINNAIVLIDQIDIESQTQPLRQAIESAAVMRLNPILLTSATTVVGLVPLYLFGGDMWSPLAVVMMSGLAAASVLTLLMVPCAYLWLYRKEAEA